MFGCLCNYTQVKNKIHTTKKYNFSNYIFMHICQRILHDITQHFRKDASNILNLNHLISFL